MRVETYVIAFLAAAAISTLLTPIVRALALRYGWVANPGGRNVHTTPTPRVGGIAMFFAFVIPLGCLIAFSPEVRALAADETNVMRIGALFAGAVTMFCVGLVDDLRGLRASHKLITHLIVGALAWACGFRIDGVEIPLLGSVSMGIFSLPITVIWIAGIINAVNLIDGLDGLAAGVVFFASVTNFVVAIISGEPLVAVWMVIVLGSVFGFLFYNFNPARIFMGDSGSYFLGFVLAVTSISAPFQKASFTVSLVAPVVALGVPIIDTLLAMLRRFLEKRPLFSPDRGHIHHRLLDMGITHRRAVLIIYGVCVCLTVGSIAIALGRSWEIGVAIIAVIAVLFGLVRFIGYFEHLNTARRQRARIRSRETERLRSVMYELRPHLDLAHTEEGVLAVLDWVRTRGGLEFVEVVRFVAATSTSPEGEGSFVKRFPASVGPRAKDVVTARFPLGPERRAHADVKFGWSSEFGDVSPHTDILLQIVVDAVARRLEELDSELVSRPEAEAEAIVEAASALLQTSE